MKIITLEEHANDPQLAAATQSALLDMAPFIKNFAPPALIPGALEDIGAGRIADMDAHGIDRQVLSFSNYPQVLPPAQAVALCRAANDRLDAAVRAHPNRFAAFATLPLSDPAAAAAELERTVTQLGFKGALISGRPEAGPRFLDDEKYEPVLAKASELRAPLYLHPGFPYKAVVDTYYDRLDPVVTANLATFAWGWHNEPGVHILRLILSGAFDRHPNLRVIAGHWGEMVPFFLARLDASLPPATTGLKRSISGTFKDQVYVTPSGMFTLPEFKYILETLGAERILYSADYPYLPNQGARAFLENAPISQADKEKIAHGNAEKLFNL